jgi:RimJ/RimL family protein N-acetyltransferase
MKITTFNIGEYVFIDYTQLPEFLHKQVYAARISDAIRNQMVHTELFSYNDHLRFVSSLNYMKERVYWAVCEKDLFLLSINLHSITWNEKGGEWGIYINPPYEGKKIAQNISRAFFKYMAENTLLEIIKAKVKWDNLRSIHFHQIIGFTIVFEDESFVYMNNRLMK